MVILDTTILADALISADRAFAHVPGVRWVDAASDDLAAFL